MKIEDSNPPTAPLISIIKRTHDSFINAKINEYGLSSGTYPILIAIYNNDGIIQEELADLFHLNESTVTRAINKLESNGFIVKSLDEFNKRKNYIEITGKGKKVASIVIDFEYEWDEFIGDALSGDDYMKFKEALEGICEMLINLEI